MGICTVQIQKANRMCYKSFVENKIQQENKKSNVSTYFENIAVCFLTNDRYLYEENPM